MLYSPKDIKRYAMKISLCFSPSSVVVYAFGSKCIQICGDALIGMFNLHLKDASGHRSPNDATL